MKLDHPRLLILISRSASDDKYLHVQAEKVWYSGKHTDRPTGKVRRSRMLIDELVRYPEPVEDVLLLLEAVSSHVYKSPSSGAVLRTPGRERSGFEHVLPPLEPPPGRPPEPTATTSDEIVVNPGEPLGGHELDDDPPWHQ